MVLPWKCMPTTQFMVMFCSIWLVHSGPGHVSTIWLLHCQDKSRLLCITLMQLWHWLLYCLDKFIFVVKFFYKSRHCSLWHMIFILSRHGLVAYEACILTICMQHILSLHDSEHFCFIFFGINVLVVDVSCTIRKLLCL